jgi:hypothetical protein
MSACSLTTQGGRDNLFVFYYSGHGSSRGHLCFAAESYLSPREVLELWKMRARGGPRDRLLIVLDSCHAGESPSKLPRACTVPAARGATLLTVAFC